MTIIGQRLIERWNSGPDHDGLSDTMLTRAVTLGWLTTDERAALTS